MTSEHTTDPQPSIWQTSFSDEDRQAQMADDSLAWNRVAGLLLAVVAVGLILAVLAVILAG
jgi:hypothetical protein